MVNKLVGMSLQLVGGLLVLYSVNDNLGLFRDQSLKSTVVAWLKAFPWVRKPIHANASGVMLGAVTCSATGTGRLQPNSIEERVAELERMLADLHMKLQQEIQAINARIETARSELQQQITDTSAQLEGLSKRMEQATVGGFKLQAFGVALAIYGAITSVFA